MAYIKSLLVGFAAAAATTIAWSVGEMVFLLPRIRYMNIAETGSGGIGAATDVSYGPFIGIAAFALGFYLMLRRLKLRGISK